MATTRRSVNIYINGREIANTIKGITVEKRKLTRELNNMVVGSEEYNKKAAEIQKLTKHIVEHRKNLSGVESTWDKLRAGAGRFVGFAVAAFTTTAIVSFGKELFNLGAEMELLEKKARTVFGEALPLVTAEAERNATAMGLTTSQYIDQAAAIGDLLIPMGFQREEAASISTELVNLSGALSEWTGGTISAEQASQILSKAMLGEREQLKTLGIAISEADVQARLAEKGMKGLTGEMLQQAKAAVTLELITQKSVDAQAAYADGAGTLVRRQAEMSAKISEIREKLATALMPVFERLVTIAGLVADGLLKVTDTFTGLLSPAKAATDAFDDQSAKVAMLEKDLLPLLARYDELKGKSNLTKEEQEELSRVIQRIGEITPAAITQIDEYGNVLGINAEKSREFYEAEKARLEFVNKEAITSLEKQIQKTRDAIRVQQEFVEAGGSQKLVEGIKETGARLQFVAATAAQLDEARKKVVAFSNEVKGAEAELRRLRGEPVGPTATTPPEGGGGGLDLAEEAERQRQAEERAKEAERRAKDRAKEARREEDDLRKKLERLQEVTSGFQEKARLQTLSEFDRTLAEAEARYDKEIAQAIALEEKKVAGAAEQRLKLEQLKEQELQRLRDENLAKELDQINRDIEEKGMAEIEKEWALFDKKKEVQDAINEILLSDREREIMKLDEFYRELAIQAERFGLDSTKLLEDWEKKKAELNKKFLDDKIKDEKDADQKIYDEKIKMLEAQQQVFMDYSNALTDLVGLFAEDQKEFLLFQKGVALAQIAYDTATAISSVIAAAANSSLTPIDLALKISVGIATVVANIVKAKELISGVVVPEVPQRYTGGLIDVTGGQDGRKYRARYLGERDTGMLPSSPSLVLASERGPEYFVANEDMRNPAVLNYVRAIENIRMGRVGQFQDGGPTETLPGTDRTDAETANLLKTQIVLLKEISNKLETIEASVPDDTITALFRRYRQLQEAAGGGSIL